MPRIYIKTGENILEKFDKGHSVPVGINALGKSLNIDSDIPSLSKDEGTDALSPSEALFGFGGWLTARKKKTVASSADNAAPMADAVSQFIKSNNLSDPKEGWEKSLVHPD